jgi:hypothetical protein
MTRSIVALSQGELGASVRLHPGGIALVLGTLLQAGFQSVALVFHVNPKHWYRGTRYISASVLAAVLGSWIVCMFI